MATEFDNKSLNKKSPLNYSQLITEESITLVINNGSQKRDFLQRSIKKINATQHDRCERTTDREKHHASS